MKNQKLTKILEDLGITKSKKINGDKVVLLLNALSEDKKFLDAKTLSKKSGIDYKSVYIYLKELSNLDFINIDETYYGNRKKLVYSLSKRTVNACIKDFIDNKVKDLKDIKKRLK
ncbi:MAG: hypothetical protein ACOCRX_02040 [Candidatus Woesearchaeota archaeon]